MFCRRRHMLMLTVHWLFHVFVCLTFIHVRRSSWFPEAQGLCYFPLYAYWLTIHGNTGCLGQEVKYVSLLIDKSRIVPLKNAALQRPRRSPFTRFGLQANEILSNNWCLFKLNCWRPFPINILVYIEMYYEPSVLLQNSNSVTSLKYGSMCQGKRMAPLLPLCPTEQLTETDTGRLHTEYYLK